MIKFPTWSISVLEGFWGAEKSPINTVFWVNRLVVVSRSLVADAELKRLRTKLCVGLRSGHLDFRYKTRLQSYITSSD